jgi:hypothetical protein
LCAWLRRRKFRRYIGRFFGLLGCCPDSLCRFLRKSDGTLSSFIIAGNSNLQVNAMNNWSTIVGSSFDSNNSSSDLYKRFSGGGIKSVFGSSHGAIGPAAINDKGIVVGTDFGGDTQYGMRSRSTGA